MRFPVTGDNEVKKTVYDNGRLWINDTQYFEPVLPQVWAFCVGGGYQVARKWLEERKGRALEAMNSCSTPNLDRN